MTSWDKFCIPQIALRWYKIHLPSSSSQWQSPWDAWSHRDNQEATCQKQNLNFQLGCFPKARLTTHRKNNSTYLFWINRVCKHTISVFPAIIDTPSSPKSENKTVPKRMHRNAITHRHKQLNTKPKEEL